MKASILLALSVVVSGSAFTPAPAMARADVPPAPVFPNSSLVGLTPPTGMTLSASFSGFEDKSGASILIMDMPGDRYAELATGMTPERMKPTGFIAEGGWEPLAVTGGEGQVIHGSQRAHGTDFRKHIAMLHWGDDAAMITIQVPEGSALHRNGLSDSEVAVLLRGVRFRTPPTVEEQLAALPFRVGDLAGFRAVKSFLGNSLLLTDGPNDVDPPADQPTVIVAQSLGAVFTAGQELAFARKAITSFDRMDDIAETAARSYRQGALPAVQTHGTGSDKDTGRPLVWSQTILFHDGGYTRIIGFAPREKAEAIDRADRLAASIVLK